MLLLIVTIFIAPDTKGSRSWLILGPVSLQPAEFAKFATALALAKYMSAYSFTMKNWKSSLMLAFLILFPHVADYPTAGDGFGIGVLCIFPDALSGGNAGRGTVLGYMCSGLLCGGHPF